MDADALQNLGQKQYQNANFVEALEAFSKALQLPKADAVGILDNRAATYAKLGNLNAALQDGRRIIKAAKTDARGYLRTAKLLLLTEKYDTALQTYQYALRVLPSGNAGRRQIEQLAAKLDRKLHGPKVIDPFTRLPLEIVSMILEYFDFSYLTRLQRVSKSWQTVLLSLPGLWAHLDLSTARRSVSFRSIQAFLRRANGSNVSRVTLATVVPSHVPKVMSILAQCRRLSYLDIRLKAEADELHKYRKLTTLITSTNTEITMTRFIHILNSCSLLEHVEVCLADATQMEYDTFPSRLDNLRYLAIACSPKPFSGTFWAPGLPLFSDGTISEKLPNLEELYLQDCLNGLRPPNRQHFLTFEVSKLSRLRKIGLLRLQLQKLPEFPESLEHFSFSQSTLAASLNPDATLKPLPNLNSATLNGAFYNFPHGRFPSLLFSEPRPLLKRLDLERSPIMSRTILTELMQAGHFEPITELNIAGISDVNDGLTSVIVHTMPNLKILDVSMTRITGLTIVQLVNAEKLKIEKICARKLESPLSKDAVEYAQKRGVQIVRSLNRTIEEKLAQPRR